jgi:Sulfotransferase family
MTALPEREPAAQDELLRAPDFYIVGHAKCGTTALYEMLNANPQIFMPALKEPLYFATDLRMRFQRRAAGALPTELADYLELFDPAQPGQLVGEASSSYLWSHEAAANIAALRPDARITSSPRRACARR